jgi:hypothetical protein
MNYDMTIHPELLTDPDGVRIVRDKASKATGSRLQSVVPRDSSKIPQERANTPMKKRTPTVATRHLQRAEVFLNSRSSVAAIEWGDSF